MLTKGTKREMSSSRWPNNLGGIEMNKPEKFWDRVAENYDNTEERFEPIHVKVVENSKKYLKVSDIVLDYVLTGSGS